MKITSVNNDLIKETAKLLRGRGKYRDIDALFLLEGKKCIEEAIQSGLEIERIFVLEGVNEFNAFSPIEVTEAVMSKISDAKSAPKAVAVAKQMQPVWSEKYKKVALLEGIKDAGNLGTILRTAAAFEIDAIVLYGDTVDLYNPKCVRSAVGNLWKVPVFKFDDLTVFNDYERIATLPKGINVTNLKDYKPAEKVLIMFGSEADGLSEELKNFATKNITIEMAPTVESLNLSVSASIIFYSIMPK